MNKKLEEFARKTLKYNLSCCGRAEQDLFKRMYSPMADLSLPIATVIDQMEADKLDWAMTQVDNTMSDKSTKESIQKEKKS